MLYFELGLCDEDYLTDKEYNLFWRFTRIVCNIKSFFGIVVKKKDKEKTVYVVPKINKKFLKRINRIIKISGVKQVCISDELFYKNDFLNLMKQNGVNVLNGKWIFKYLLENIINYLLEISKDDIETKEIALLVDKDYELAVEYIRILANKFKLITVVTNSIIGFTKVSDRLLKEDGIDINLINNYRKSINKSDYIVNIDFSEKEIKKYTINNKACFINLENEYEIKHRRFDGINITNCQIAIPERFLKYANCFKNFNYLNVYESFIKKKTSISNILNEIETDNLEIIFLENESGMIKNDEITRINPKILDK